MIILDGFDEMKHAMTKAEFSAISKEIRKLVLINSKILLLGRPDAVVTGEEHSILVKGRIQFSGIEIDDTIAAEFEEVRLDFFSKSEYLEFLRKYITCYYDKSDATEYVGRRLKEIEGLGVEDLIKRPVQARMLAQILLNPKNSVDRLSRYDLYNLFIEDCLSREEEKPQRRKLDRATRKKFMQDLSWWLWGVKRTRTFTVSDIPPVITAHYIQADRDQLGQLRELLVGSLVEEQSIGSLLSEKDAGTFYFPHLSFTEFLVAEYLIERELKSADIEILAESFDGEIKSFVKGYKEHDGLFKLYKDLQRYYGKLPWHVIDFLSESKTLRSKIRKIDSPNIPNIWQFCVELLAVIRLQVEKPEKLTNDSLGKMLSTAASLVGLDDYRTTVIATQLLLKVFLEQEHLRTQIAQMALIAIFRGLSMDRLAAVVRDGHYRFTSETERFFATIATHIHVKDEVFTFDVAEVFALIAEDDNAIVDSSVYSPVTAIIKIGSIRKSLRTRHDQDRFDRWLRDVGERRVLDDYSIFRGGLSRTKNFNR